MLMLLQLLKNLRRSVATLDICGEWGTADDEAALEVKTDRVWMEGRAQQKRLSALQASFHFISFCALQSGVWSQMRLIRRPGLKAQVAMKGACQQCSGGLPGLLDSLIT